MKNSMIHKDYFLSGFMILTILLIMPAKAFSAGPRETLENNLNQILEVLREPGAERKSKIEKITEITEKLFDFRAIAERSLGVYWRKLGEGQKKRFVELYKSLLKKTYADKILSYEGEKINYEKTIKFGDNNAEVFTSVPTKNGKIPVNYRMYKNDGDWKVYDVVIEGVSLVGNYKSQFTDILARKSIDELFNILEKKTAH